MTIYDKAQWHIDGGENPQEVVARMKAVFNFLADSDMLSEDGKEIMEFGVDTSVSLHENLVTPAGKKLLDSHYNEILEVSIDKVYEKLRELAN